MSKANTPLDQICKNTKDIKELKEIIAPLYSCSIDLSTDSESVSKTNTNINADIEKGFIIDIVGNLYKFMGFNTDKTIVYIEYYASIKGPKGDKGDKGDSGETDKGIYITSTAPTESEGVLTLSSANLNNINLDIPIKTNDLIIYLDANDEPTTIYLIASINETTLTLNKIGDYAKGKKTYKHCISLIGGSNVNCLVEIDNSNNEPIGFEGLSAFLQQHYYYSSMVSGQTGNYEPFYRASGFSNNTAIVGIYKDSNTNNLKAVLSSRGSENLYSVWTIDEKIFEI